VKTLTVVIPVFNEASVIVPNLHAILEQCQAIPEAKFKVLVVDDGSSDGLGALLKVNFADEPALHYLKLNQNFGKEAAITAGLARIKDSDAVIVMDSDLQHPPALIAQMLTWWQQGFEVVEACKKSRGNEGIFSKLASSTFYALFDRFTGLQIRNQSDFKLLDKKVVDFYCGLPEKERFFRGLISWMHFKTTQIFFDVPAGTRLQSTWSRWRLIKYAVRSITSFTSFPLQIVTIFGGFTFLLSIVLGTISIVKKLSGTAADGFSTVILLILIIGSVLMFSLGLIGVYIARIYEEVKRRPAFIVDEHSSRVNDL
jgi:polyisoprenyl-phosphate glycosyltransferase